MILDTAVSLTTLGWQPEPPQHRGGSLPLQNKPHSQPGHLLQRAKLSSEGLTAPNHTAVNGGAAFKPWATHSRPFPGAHPTGLVQTQGAQQPGACSLVTAAPRPAPSPHTRAPPLSQGTCVDGPHDDGVVCPQKHSSHLSASPVSARGTEQVLSKTVRPASLSGGVSSVEVPQQVPRTTQLPRLTRALGFGEVAFEQQGRLGREPPPPCLGHP